MVSLRPIIERVYIQRIQQDNKVTDYLTECKILLLGVLVEMSSHPEKLPAYIYDYLTIGSLIRSLSSTSSPSPSPVSYYSAAHTAYACIGVIGRWSQEDERSGGKN